MASTNETKSKASTHRTLLVVRDIGSEFEPRDLASLAEQLSARLHEPVTLYNENDPSISLVDVVEQLIQERIQQLTLLPFGLLAIPERGVISQALIWARRQSPELKIHLASPLTWLDASGWLRSLAIDATEKMDSQPEKTGVLLVGPSSPNPMTNANLPCLAHLIREPGLFAAVQHAFLDALPPTIEEAIRSTTLSRAESIVTIPWLLFGERHTSEIADALQKACGDGYSHSQITPLNLIHPTFLNLLVANHFASNPMRLPDVDQQSSSTAKTPNASSEGGSTTISREALDELDSRINAMLPPEYQGAYEKVSPQSMGTAGLKFDSEGKVAWDEIWTSFCDLALAGGPPHRGTLLEAVTAEEASAEKEQYEVVVEEIGRGIRMVTGLPIIKSKSLGWVGVRCQSEEMAIWLMRAIIVENVMVRRENDIIYLPAGPRFTLKREIKNVVTAVAKTVHYWTAHLNARRQMNDSNSDRDRANFTTNPDQGS